MNFFPENLYFSVKTMRGRERKLKKKTNIITFFVCVCLGLKRAEKNVGGYKNFWIIYLKRVQKIVAQKYYFFIRATP